MSLLKLPIANVKLKDVTLVAVHFESVVNDLVIFIRDKFPNFDKLKNDLHFLEAILQVVISTLEESQSPADEKSIIVEVFKRLFSLSEADVKTLGNTVDYLISNKIVVKSGKIGKAIISIKKKVSSAVSLLSISKTS